MPAADLTVSGGNLGLPLRGVFVNEAVEGGVGVGQVHVGLNVPPPSPWGGLPQRRFAIIWVFPPMPLTGQVLLFAHVLQACAAARPRVGSPERPGVGGGEVRSVVSTRQGAPAMRS